MRAILFDGPGRPLRQAELPVPVPAADEVLIKIAACAVCRTDLHIVDGELGKPKRPLVLGHEIVGTIVDAGTRAGLAPGTRVGVPWLGWTCGRCRYCRNGQENLCPEAQFTGYDRDGGFAEYCVADARYCFPLAEALGTVAAAPLMCAGLIGYRTYRKTGTAHRLGIYGFGAAAHILAQVAVHEGREVYAFTKPGDGAAQTFARSLRCTWAGGSDATPPAELDAAVIFAPVGALVPQALRAVRPGGCVVCGGIHMSDIPAFPYDILWGERSVHSVANLTRADGTAFLKIAAEVPVRTACRIYPLAEAARALDDLRHGRLEGAAVLVP
jgi:propanol-preferring alcohol dehydrogenase